jgi:ubiquinone/menaquinone biosynthesis C-methylase UbiE
MAEPADLLDEILGDVRGRDVLDVGCGAGWLVRRLAGAGARAVGVDPLAGALDRARAEDPGAGRYVEAGAQELPFGDACFDVVVFFNSLHHVPVEDLDRAVAEAARVLRGGGVIYVQEPLAEGEFFELAKAVDDETAIRAAAQAALDRATAAGRLVERDRRDAPVTLRLADFEALRSMMVGVDPQRAAAIEDHETQLRDAFGRLGRASGAGREFEAPVRVRVLAPA